MIPAYLLFFNFAAPHNHPEYPRISPIIQTEKNKVRIFIVLAKQISSIFD